MGDRLVVLYDQGTGETLGVVLLPRENSQGEAPTYATREVWL